MAYILQDALLVCFDLLRRKQLPDFVFSRRISDPRRSTTHEQDWPVTRLLQAAQRHQLYEIADMETRRRAVETDIGGDALTQEKPVERFRIRTAMEMAPRHKGLHEIGAKAMAGGHGRTSPWFSPAASRPSTSRRSFRQPRGLPLRACRRNDWRPRSSRT